MIDTERLSKYYGQRVGVQDVTLAVREGELFGFLGPNGSGKTTIIRLLLGFLRASAGRATIAGLDCWRDSRTIKRLLGYVPGDVRLYPWMTAVTAMRIVERIRGMPLLENGKVLAERFRLELNVPVRKMSRGMRQKLAIILALVHRPRLLILDEPTTGLDPLMQHQLSEALRELTAAGHTVFFSSHTLSEVEQLCDRVAIVRDGHVVADEKVHTLRMRAPREVTLTFQDVRTAQTVPPPPQLTIDRRNGKCWKGQLIGSASELIRWAAQQPIEDVTIGQPNLQHVFQQFYEHSRAVAQPDTNLAEDS